MQLIFPTSFGSYSFFTFVELSDSKLKSVKIVEEVSNSQILKEGSLVVSNIPKDKAFSIDQLNTYFKSETKIINDSIDKFLMKKIEKKD